MVSHSPVHSFALRLTLLLALVLVGCGEPNRGPGSRPESPSSETRLDRDSLVGHYSLVKDDEWWAGRDVQNAKDLKLIMDAHASDSIERHRGDQRALESMGRLGVVANSLEVRSRARGPRAGEAVGFVTPSEVRWRGGYKPLSFKWHDGEATTFVSSVRIIPHGCERCAVHLEQAHDHEARCADQRVQRGAAGRSIDRSLAHELRD